MMVKQFHFVLAVIPLMLALGTAEASAHGGLSGSTPNSLTCPAFPAFPDAGCTGWAHTGVTLHNCDSLTDNGYIWDQNPIKTFDSCLFSQNLRIQAAGVTITRSKIHGTISPHWSNNFNMRGLALRDVEIEDSGDSGVTSTAVSGDNFQCLRCDIHHTRSGIYIGDNAVVQDSYIHDFNYIDASYHAKAILAAGGHGDGARVLHNNIQCNGLPGQSGICTSAMSLYDDLAPLDNVLTQYNLFNTNGYYCVYGGGYSTSISFLDNRFGKMFSPLCGIYGPVVSFEPGSPGNVWSGNAWADGSGPVNP